MTTTFRIDPHHTDILFQAKHMMVTTVRGKFHDVAGEIELDETAPERSRATIRIAAASLNSGVEPRDQHLRSPDFFDAERYPEIRFESTAIESAGRNRWAVTGDLTIRDTSRPIRFELEPLGFYAGMSGSRRIGLTGRFTINRKDWGLNWNVALEAGGWLVSEEVRIDLDVAAEVASAAVPVEAGAA